MSDIHTSQVESVRGLRPLTSPLTSPLIYDDALHGIYAFLNLTELVRAARTCKHWMAAAVKKQAGRPLSCVYLAADALLSGGLRRSPLVKHMAPLRLLTDSVPTMDDLETRHGIRMSAAVWDLAHFAPDGISAIPATFTHVDIDDGPWYPIQFKSVLDNVIRCKKDGISSTIEWVNLSRTHVRHEVMAVLLRACPHLTSLEPGSFAFSVLPRLNHFSRLTRVRIDVVAIIDESNVDVVRTEWNYLDFSRITHLTLVAHKDWINLFLEHGQHARVPRLQSLTVIQRESHQLRTVRMQVQCPSELASTYAYLREELGWWGWRPTRAQ